MSDFEDLAADYKTIKIGGQDVKVQLTAKEVGRLSLCMKKDMIESDADKITDIMVGMITRANPTLNKNKAENIVAYNFAGILEQMLMLCNPSLTKEDMDKAKAKAVEEKK